MAGSQAIDGYYNPYFIQAYQSPNYYQAAQAQQAAQVQQSSQTQQAAQTQQVAAEQNSVFPYSVPQVEEPKKSNTTAWCVLGAAALIGTACLINRGRKTGAEGLWKQFISGIKSFGKNAKNQVFTLNEQNGQRFCSIPGKENIIKAGDSAIDDLAKIGIKDGTTFNGQLINTLDDGTKKLAEGITIKKGTFKVGDKLVTFEGDKITKITNNNGEDVLASYLEKTADDIKTIDDYIAGFRKGDKIEDIYELEFEHYLDDVTRTFTRQSPTDDFVFRQAKTNRFPLNAEAVNAYRLDHPEIDAILNEFNSGKKVGQILNAEFDGGDIGTILVENGSVIGLKDRSGKLFKPDSDYFKSRKYLYKELFEKALKNESDFITVTRVVA